MGRSRRCWGTDEVPKIDLRQPQVRRDARELCRRGLPLRPSREGRTCDVELVLSSCRFGGSRPWLLCPRCGRRVLVLYWLDGWRPGCRRCLRLVYPSQRASRDVLRTGQLHVQALVRRFVPDWQYGDPFPEKPPGVWRNTWSRLCEAVEGQEAFIDGTWLPRVVERLRGSSPRGSQEEATVPSRRTRTGRPRAGRHLGMREG